VTSTLLHWMVLACLAYLSLVYLMYFALVGVGAVENAMRRREATAEDYGTLASSRFTIPVSVLLAAYNEAGGVAAAVQSLLAMDYPEFEVIVVNDGSTDETLDVLRAEFGLEPYEIFARRIVETQPVRCYFRSVDHPNLVVVDKENGGKADALNAALNLARYRFICGVDADTIFAKDALLKGMRLVIADPGNVIGVTSHLTIAKDPERTMADPPGRRRIDRKPLLAFQHLDYLRAFLNNRLAWSRLNFMLCAVGAFQIWRRDVLEELGGWARGFTCEDIELTFRAHERMLRSGKPYRILCLPDNVGTTEGPDTIRKLVAQRERWQRVILETVWGYRRMAFNPRYRSVGLVGTPYYVLSEVLAPFFEIAALATLTAGAILGTVSWPAFGLFVAVIAFVNGALTACAILADDRQSRTYRPSDLAWLLVIALLDIICYRPVIAWARAKGTWRFLRRDRAWHKFERNRRPHTEVRAPGAALDGVS
jgi:cellulose synthase/poly-beta-1,6-N-acetylglucosamine synthase-like glycosyltransferase